MTRPPKNEPTPADRLAAEMKAARKERVSGPDEYRPKRGGAPQTWHPTVTVRIRMTADDAAYYKARMGEHLSKLEAERTPR